MVDIIANVAANGAQQDKKPMAPKQVMGRKGAKWALEDKRNKGLEAEWMKKNNWMRVQVSRLRLRRARGHLLWRAPHAHTLHLAALDGHARKTVSGLGVHRRG